MVCFYTSPQIRKLNDLINLEIIFTLLTSFNARISCSDNNSSCIKIFNLAIVPDNDNSKKMEFFYCLEDAPNYQVFSNSKSFVRKHFPDGIIVKKLVDCIKFSDFLKKQNIHKIDYLSIDIEGMDYSVLMKLDLKKFKIENISFEHLHLTFWQKIKIVTKLINNGYYFSGMGFDVRKSVGKSC